MSIPLFIKSQVYQAVKNNSTISPFLQQDNNPIKVKEFTTHFEEGSTVAELYEKYPADLQFTVKNHTEDAVIPYTGSVPVDFIVITGIVYVALKQDPTQPIVLTENTTEARTKAIEKAYEKHVVEKTLTYIFPRFDDSIVDIVITSAPDAAIIDASSDANPFKDAESDEELEKVVADNLAKSVEQA